MDLSWSAQDLEFRAEVRAFLDENLTPELRRAGRLTTRAKATASTGFSISRRYASRSRISARS